MGINGRAAADTMLSFGTWRPGYCLEAVWVAYKRHGARTERSAPTATVGWERSDDKHPGDRNPPPGVPVWWGPKRSSSAGDVVISLGGGRVVATDWPRNGVIGITTIDARERQIGRPYLGWTGAIFDARIDYPGAASPAPQPARPTPPPPREDDDMLLLRIHGLGPSAHLAALGTGTFRHFIGTDPFQKIMQLSRINDDWQDVHIVELPALLRTYGCDLNIWDYRGGNFVVLDPLDGSVKTGNVWTAHGAVRAAIAGIKLPELDPAPIIAALREIMLEDEGANA